MISPVVLSFFSAHHAFPLPTFTFHFPPLSNNLFILFPPALFLFPAFHLPTSPPPTLCSLLSLRLHSSLPFCLLFSTISMGSFPTISLPVHLGNLHEKLPRNRPVSYTPSFRDFKRIVMKSFDIILNCKPAEANFYESAGDSPSPFAAGTSSVSENTSGSKKLSENLCTSSAFTASIFSTSSSSGTNRLK